MSNATFTPRSPLALLALACGALSGNAVAQTYAPWLTQIGLTGSIASAAKWGQNQLIGVVDTGIVASNAMFVPGQVSTSLSSCAAISFRCSYGVNDDNGHGTAVASMAAGNAKFAYSYTYGGATAPAGSIIGVAPNANIVAEKVLAANGSGTNVDVVNGIMRAANAGASVINLSLTYMNSPDIVTAVNYAAGKGAFIVWAGGNSAVNLLSNANTKGLSQAAISRLVFAGSVNARNGISSFSNKPGSGNLISTTGSATSVATRWLMAPGENIVGPGVQYGNGVYMYWSGTSMAAPIVSGSIALLQSAWPILRTNGTTANLLLATATDLGTKGVDATYGGGRVNLGTAFQPYGTLTVTGANGSAIAVPTLTSAMLTKGALGNLATIKSKLASVTSFDGYQRNFTVNLSGLISSATAKAVVNPLPVNSNTGPTKIKLTDGGELAYASEPAAAGSTGLPPTIGLANLSASSAIESPRNGYMMLTDRIGNTLAMGYGMPLQYAYAMSLYGDDEFARATQSLDVSRFSNLAQGGPMAAYGFRLGESTRIAASFGGSNPVRSMTPTQLMPTWSGADASAMTLGVSHRFDTGITAGASYTTLDERHGLLGTTYDPTSLVSLGDRNRTHAIGVSVAFRFGAHDTVVIESQWASAQANGANGLLAGTSGVRARGIGMSYSTRDVLLEQDRLTATVRQPLRIHAGEVGLVTSGVDELGRQQVRTEWTSLVPDGREIDYRMSYDVALGKHKHLAVQLGFHRDHLNVAGNHEVNGGVIWRSRF